MDKAKTESFSLLALYIGVALLLFFVFAPFLLVLSLAAVFAILLHAPYEKLTRRFKVSDLGGNDGGWLAPWLLPNTITCDDRPPVSPPPPPAQW